MRYRIGLAAGFMAAVLLLVSPSHAAETAFGSGDARSCFEAAQFNEPALSAIASCSKALEPGNLTREDHAATLINRGILKARLSDLPGALADYEAGLALQPDLADAYIDRGAVLFAMKRYEDAIGEFSKGIALGAQYLNVAYFDRGLAREHIRDFKGACADYQQAINFQPNFAAAKHLVDICHAIPRSNPS